MTALHLAAGLAIAAAAGHSFLSERLFLGPLRRETTPDGVFATDGAKRLAVAMFHLASLCWIGMAVSMLMLDPGAPGYRAALGVYAGIYAISGLGNFWAVGRPHPGGVILLLTSALILAVIYA
jgi:hypothetical protein